MTSQATKPLKDTSKALGEFWDISKLHEWEQNPRSITTNGFNRLKKQIQDLGQYKPLLITGDGEVLGGNMRLKAYRELGIKKLWVSIVHPKDKNEKMAYALSDNDRAGYYDSDLLANLLPEFDIDWENFAVDFKDPVTLDSFVFDTDREGTATLQEQFLIPPFSVFDTRQGYWVQRKHIWTQLIRDKGESRDNTLGLSSLQTGKFGKDMPTMSILDPVLAEVAVRWFNPKGGKTIDPFAGDTVFGFVSATLGSQFTGIELRQEQVDLNQKRVKDLQATYICDDGQNIAKHIKPNSQDLLFSCPPYFDLEHYSDLPNDSSNQDSFKDYLTITHNAFKGAVSCLKQNRFAFIVISDIRDKQGNYRQLPSAIINIFNKLGFKLYNEIVLINAVGTGAIRAKKAFGNRKVIRLHQNILVFYRGDVDKIKDNYQLIEFNENEISNI